MELVGNQKLLKYLVNNGGKPIFSFINVFNKIINLENLIHYIQHRDSQFFQHWQDAILLLWNVITKHDLSKNAVYV